jgi:hypothetical protein
MAKKRPTRSGAKSKTYRVFVSHATADKWLATVICEKLESVGVTTFRDDRDINGGDDIPEEIRDAINDCNELLVVLTPESVDRPWVLFEVGAAWGRKKMRITAVLCHVTADRIPDLIKSKKAVPINQFDAYMSELSQRVAKE